MNQLSNSGFSRREQREFERLFLESKRIVDRVARLERAQDARLTTVVSGDGSGFRVVDEDGRELGVIASGGDLFRYTSTVKPVTPSMPEVFAVPGGFQVVLGDGVPDGVGKVLVHASTDPGFMVGPSTVVGTIWDDTQATVTLWGGVWNIAVQFVSRSGVVSDPSPVVVVEVPALVDEDTIEEALDETQAQIDEANDRSREFLEALNGLAEGFTQSIETAKQDINKLDDLVKALQDGTLTPEDIARLVGSDPVVTDAIIANEGLWAGAITAINANLQTLTVTEKANFASAFAQQLWAEMGVIRRLQSETAWIDTGMVRELSSERVTVTQDFVARLARVLKIEAGMIEANAITSSHIRAGALDGTVITGPLIQTERAPEQGVKWTSEGIMGWDEDGNKTISLNGKLNTLSGRIVANHRGAPGIVIKPSNDNWKDQSDPNSSRRSGVYFAQKPNQGLGRLFDTAGMYIQNPTNTGPEDLYINAQNGGAINLNSRLNARVGNTDVSNLRIFQGELAVINNTGRRAVTVNQNYAVFDNNVSVGPAFSIMRNRSTDYRANVHMDSNGILYKTTSSARYKIDQRVHDTPEALLDLDVKTFLDGHAIERQKEARTKKERIDNGSGETWDHVDELDLNPVLERIPGLIAEDVAQIDPTFVTYTEDGQVESIQYEALAVACFPLMRRQRDRIEKLETTVEDLRTRLERLEHQQQGGS
ncbi:hypothetical protein [Auritidibacter sp. NML100628]|uniref:hypothetical protein n=1 Tax=Auritidibacter sp. NML100628 TaxID=2170742 RepID=UPI000D73C4CC|nr:hypothetical protein [Auritidibacter sp. NML100628]PXA77939.1 hypothetical protein DCC24_03325 [Auritidibacter sp. NML100628]